MLINNKMPKNSKKAFKKEKEELKRQLRFIECSEVFANSFHEDKELEEDNIKKAIIDFGDILKTYTKQCDEDAENKEIPKERVDEYRNCIKQFEDVLSDVKDNFERRQRFNEFEFLKKNLEIYKSVEVLSTKLTEFENFAIKLFTDYDDPENLKNVKKMVDDVRDALTDSEQEHKDREKEIIEENTQKGGRYI